jgi:hypothetical protein
MSSQDPDWDSVHTVRTRNPVNINVLDPDRHAQMHWLVQVISMDFLHFLQTVENCFFAYLGKF